jgi:hypothetical protein
MCAEEYSDYFTVKYGSNFEAADSYIQTGSQFWAFSDNMDGFLRLSNKAREILEKLLQEGDPTGYSEGQILSLKSDVEHNSLEAYLIEENDQEFLKLVDSLNSNPTVSDSYKLIIQGLNAISINA